MFEQDLVDAVIDEVYDAVGDNFTEDEVVEAIRASNYDAKRSISYLLDEDSYEDEPKKKKPSKPSAPSKKPAATAGKTAPAAKLPASTTPAKATTGKSSLNNAKPSALAQDLCASTTHSTPQQSQLRDVKQAENSGMLVEYN